MYDPSRLNNDMTTSSTLLHYSGTARLGGYTRHWGRSFLAGVQRRFHRLVGHFFSSLPLSFLWLSVVFLLLMCLCMLLHILSYFLVLLCPALPSWPNSTRSARAITSTQSRRIIESIKTSEISREDIILFRGYVKKLVILLRGVVRFLNCSFKSKQLSPPWYEKSDPFRRWVC